MDHSKSMLARGEVKGLSEKVQKRMKGRSFGGTYVCLGKLGRLF